MKERTDFEDIRPYHDSEVRQVISRLVDDPQFKRVIENYIFPDGDWDDFVRIMKTFDTKDAFQTGLVKSIVMRIVNASSDSVETGGWENIEKGMAYTYMSNHRDIVLDASLLAVLLSYNGHSTTEVAIGDNLLAQPWIEDIVRLNKSFIVKRGVSFREQLQASIQLSQYIHYAIEEKHESVWIAQREGRAKNSDDRTQESLLKMLAMGGDKEDFLSNICSLNILPVSLSYEYDPCDFLKAKEFQQRRDNPDFRKTRQDDLLSMETGLFGYKGRIHFHFGVPIKNQLSALDSETNKSELAKTVAGLIDREIFSNYKLYPINYLSYDMLWGNGGFKDKYAQEEEAIQAYFREQIEKIDLPDKDIDFLQEKLYEMYGYPVRNNLST